MESKILLRTGSKMMRVLNLSKDLYSIENIERTAKVYKDYAKIKVKNEDEYYFVSFDKCKYDEDRTIKEFENYLIGLENS